MTASGNVRTPQVFVVDDDPGILVAMKRLLNSAGYRARTFSSPRDFLAEHDPQVPGCALIDIGMDELSGLELQKRLALGLTPRPIIFVTGCDDVRISVEAMKAGALDFLSKPVMDTVLLAAVEHALETDRKARQAREETEEWRSHYDTLTPRERQVMAQILRGRLNKQIAYDLGIVEKTAKVHRGRVMEKMQVRSVATLAHIAERLGWLNRDARAGEEMPLKSNPPGSDPMIGQGLHQRPEGSLAMAGHGLRVAILDDDPSVRTAISRLLNASGMVSGAFATSIDLFNAMGAFHPDCIVVDLYMPGLDGLEVLNYLRQTGVGAPVIMITAQDDPGLRELCLKAGATAFMQKPLQATELLDTIMQLAGSVAS